MNAFGSINKAQMIENKQRQNREVASQKQICGTFHSTEQEKECANAKIALTRHGNVSLDDDFLIHYVAGG